MGCDYIEKAVYCAMCGAKMTVWVAKATDGRSVFIKINDTWIRIKTIESLCTVCDSCVRSRNLIGGDQ